MAYRLSSICWASQGAGGGRPSDGVAGLHGPSRDRRWGLQRGTLQRPPRSGLKPFEYLYMPCRWLAPSLFLPLSPSIYLFPTITLLLTHTHARTRTQGLHILIHFTPLCTTQRPCTLGFIYNPSVYPLAAAESQPFDNLQRPNGRCRGHHRGLLAILL